MLSFLMISLMFAGSAQATNWYISTSGADSNNGSIGTPFASFSKAQTAASPGDTIYVAAIEHLGRDEFRHAAVFDFGDFARPDHRK